MGGGLCAYVCVCVCVCVHCGGSRFSLMHISLKRTDKDVSVVFINMFL